MEAAKITPETIRQLKGREKIAALTAYDYPMAQLLDELRIPLILVGDSLAMVVLGYPDTTWLSLEEIEHHVRAAARAKPRGLLVADLPFQTYETPEAAVVSSRRLLSAGAEAVKAEGGRSIARQIRALVQAGIPFLGHIGMLPQHVHEEGGYHIKGRGESERDALIRDAEALVEAGAFAIVLELVLPAVAKELTGRIPIPTIGIGSGPDCDGQILVTTDLLGTSPGFIPRHARPQRLIREDFRAIIARWRDSLTGGR